MVSVVYIAGYGRSGSTLLDVLLGGHPRIFGGGELTLLYEAFAESARCSCGIEMPACPFWTEVVRRVARRRPGFDVLAAGRLTRRAERIFGRSGGRRYGLLWRATIEAVGEVSGKDVIVDSSKVTQDPWRRAPLLSRACGLDVSVLHLVRDPRGVMWSARKGSNRRLERGERPRGFDGMASALAGWSLSNASVEWMSRTRGGLRTAIVRYEDLAADPASELARIGSFLGIDLSPVQRSAADRASFDPGHGVAGNRMRRAGPLSVVPDEEWRSHFPRFASWLLLPVIPLLRRYGYPFASGTLRPARNTAGDPPDAASLRR